MKKLTLSILVLASIVLFSCSKEPELGTVLLDPSEKTVTFGQSFTIKPIFSETGAAKDKAFTWTSSADSIVSVKPVTGGYGEVTPKRIGEAIITYASTDGLVSKQAKITVDPRSTILNGVYYAKGATKSQIRNNITSGFDELADESNDNFLVYKSGSSGVTKLIYEFDNGSLKSAYAILTDSHDTQVKAEEYIEERFEYTGTIQDGILYYLNTGFVANTAVPVGTMIGIFLVHTVNGVDYARGVKIIDGSYVK